MKFKRLENYWKRQENGANVKIKIVDLEVPRSSRGGGTNFLPWQHGSKPEASSAQG
jgi:hypothetical protein